MSGTGIEDITDALRKSHVSESSGVTFAGKALKLNSEEDAKEIVEAINNCSNLEYLDLEGNTLGIDAAKAISQALEGHSEFKKALWKDLFTGRMKTEIPIALKHLGDGLVKSNACLTVLDLSDNAFGPIGVEGLATLLRSRPCYTLQVLKLNNNGLGIGGGKLLAGALTDCYNFSKGEGKALALKEFVAGRNRLENDGATALAQVFKIIGTLEVIEMPQNGIYHVGISALSEAFKNNPKLRVLNLNDNTIGPKGSRALSKVLPALVDLQVINFGDCLLKSQGVRLIVAELKACSKLEELILDANEIKSKAARDLISTVSGAVSLKRLSINGNCFGEEGVEEIKNVLKGIGKLDVLGSLSDDEGDSDSEESKEEDETEAVSSDESVENVEVSKVASNVSVEDFLNASTLENFMGLGDDRIDLILKTIKPNKENFLESLITVLMKTGSLSRNTDAKTQEAVLITCDSLYKELFTWAQKEDKLSILNNTLLVHLGMIKCEDKTFKPKWDVASCLFVLASVLDKNYVPGATRDTLHHFLKKDVSNGKDVGGTKSSLLVKFGNK